MKKEMKKKFSMKRIALGVFSAIAVGLVATGGLVSAYQGDITKKGPNYDSDMHDIMTAAFDSNDYAVWKDMMEQSGRGARVLEVINADNFNTFVKAHNAALSGDYETANELRAELGLYNWNGPRDGTGFGKGMNSEKRQGKNQGQRQMMNQENFADSDGDRICDNAGLMQGRGKI